VRYSYKIGDLVEIRHPYGSEECSYTIGLILAVNRIPIESPLNSERTKYKIYWLTSAGKYVKNWIDAEKISLIVAVEGNEARYAQYRAKDER